MFTANLELNDLLVWIVTLLTAIAGSTGLWHYLELKKDKISSTSQLLLGISYSIIIDIAKDVIKRGYFDESQYASVFKHLYPAFKTLGGDQLVDKYVDQIKDLPIKRDD